MVLDSNPNWVQSSRCNNIAKHFDQVRSQLAGQILISMKWVVQYKYLISNFQGVSIERKQYAISNLMANKKKLVNNNNIKKNHNTNNYLI